MSDLTNALEQILDVIEEYETRGYNFLRINSPYYKEQNDFLQPGLRLSDTEVQSILASLPFHLPQELLELYSWANGTEKWGCYSFIGDEVFYSLQEALQTYHRKYNDAVKEARKYKLDPSESWWKKHWFPIFLRDDQDYFTLGRDEQKKECPVFLFDYRDGADDYDENGQEIGPKLIYTSLTSMALTIAECLEVGAYYPVSYDCRGITLTSFKANYEKAEAIRLKYNPEATVTYRNLFPDDKLHSPGYYDLWLD